MMHLEAVVAAVVMIQAVAIVVMMVDGRVWPIIPC